jgi:hypothetical protein
MDAISYGIFSEVGHRVFPLAQAAPVQSATNAATGFVQNASAQIGRFLPSFLWALLILVAGLVVATIAASLIQSLLKKAGIDSRISGMTSQRRGEAPLPIGKWVATAVYWLILAVTLVAFLDALQLEAVSAPFNGFLTQVLSYVPRLGGAAVLLGAAWITATLVRTLVTRGLARFNLDNRLAEQSAGASGSPVVVTETLGNALYWFVLLLFLPLVLDTLQLQGLLAPVQNLLDQILSALPKVLTAGLLVAVFYFIGRFISGLVTSLLTSIGFNRITSVLGLPDLTPNARNPFDEPTGATAPRTGTPLPNRTPSQIAGIVTLVGIVLFGVVTATEVLGLPALTTMMNSILAISARVLVGVGIFAVGLYLSNLAFNLIAMSGGRQSRLLAQTARICILAFVAAMALQQMGIASSIVNLAFGLLLGAVAVAIALAFGLGGRDVAAERIRGFLNDFESGKPEDRSANGELTGSGRR